MAGQQHASKLRWQWARLGELTAQELYEALALRQRVFVLEQKCLYLDADGKDREAWHLLGWNGPALAAYLRMLPPGSRFAEHSIGRVLTSPEARAMGLGRPLMNEALRRIEAAFGPVPVALSAQAHLERFYASLGFVRRGEAYIEDGIPHLDMAKPAGS